MEVTNYTSGPRGVNLKAGGTHWVEPGETATFKKDEIAGEMPDFGKKPTTDDDAAEQAKQAKELATLKAENADLKKTVAEQSKQIEDLTKPGR